MQHLIFPTSVENNRNTERIDAAFIILIMIFFFIQNHILPLQKLHMYNGRKDGFFSFNNLLNVISKIKYLERRLVVKNRNKCARFRKKWHRTENKVF